jgi:hypothetical protein
VASRRRRKKEKGIDAPSGPSKKPTIYNQGVLSVTGA